MNEITPRVVSFRSPRVFKKHSEDATIIDQKNNSFKICFCFSILIQKHFEDATIAERHKTKFLSKF